MNPLKLDEQRAINALASQLNPLKVRQAGLNLDQSSNILFKIAQSGGVMGDIAKMQLLSQQGGVPDDVNQLFTRARDAEILRSENLAKYAGLSGAGVNQRPLSEIEEQQVAAIIRNPAIFQNLTPSVQGRLAGELEKRGYTGFGKPLPSAAVEKIALYDNIDGTINNMLSALEATPELTGPLNQYATKYAQMFGGNAPAVDFDALRSNLDSTITLMRSGQAVTESEEKRLRGMIPHMTDNAATVRTKLLRLQTELGTAQRNYMKRQTQTTGDLYSEGRNENSKSLPHGLNDDPLGLF